MAQHSSTASSTPRLPSITRWGGSDDGSTSCEPPVDRHTPRAVTSDVIGAFAPRPPAGKRKKRSGKGSSRGGRDGRSTSTNVVLRPPGTGRALDKNALQQLIRSINARVARNMTTMDVLNAKEREKQAVLKALRDEYNDVCRNCGKDGMGRHGRQPKRKDEAAEHQKKKLHLTSELKKCDDGFKTCLEERFAMEVMRERMEHEWLASVSRLRENRDLLIKNDLVDKALITTYLATCKTSKTSARLDVRKRRRKMKKEHSKRLELLDTVRSEHYRQEITAKIETYQNATQEDILATIRGDLDEKGEENLVTKKTTTVVNSMVAYQNRSAEQERAYEMSKTLQKLKDATGAEDEADLLHRFQQLEVNSATLLQDREDAVNMQQSLEEGKTKLLDSLEAIRTAGQASKAKGLFGGPEVVKFERAVRVAQDRLRLSKPALKKFDAIIFAAKWTLHSMITVLSMDTAKQNNELPGRVRSAGRLRALAAPEGSMKALTSDPRLPPPLPGQVYNKTGAGGSRTSGASPTLRDATEEGKTLVRRLDRCSEKLSAMLSELPPRFRYMNKAQRQISMAAAKESNFRESDDLLRWHAEQEVKAFEDVVDLNQDTDGARAMPSGAVDRLDLVGMGQVQGWPQHPPSPRSARSSQRGTQTPRKANRGKTPRQDTDYGAPRRSNSTPRQRAR